jgi:cellobiose phosphorylase
MTGYPRSLAALRSQARDWFSSRARGGPAGEADGEEPLRAALFSSDQMVSQGKLLAGRHRISERHRADRLLARLADNERTLESVAHALRQAVARDRAITPAAEWLLDNMYLIDEEIRTARRHLPRGYSRELPRLAENSEAADGMTPRVYDLALEAISHTDGHLGRRTLSRFLAAYQGVQPLKLGELWAFPIMLRLALIENLRRVAVRVAASLEQRDLAQHWAERMLHAAEDRPSDLILVIADMARSDLTLGSAFVAEFARRLQGQGAALALPLTWMEQRLADADETIERLVHVESQTQAAAQVSVANSIGSLRLLGATHWPEFVETLSSVEQTLRQDPSGVYGRMDFRTRDAYRHAVEAIARIARCGEPAVAQAAIELAANAGARLAAQPAPDGDRREAHVGYYLVGPGRAALERAVDAHRGSFQPEPGRSPLPAYVGAIAIFALLMSVGPMRQATDQMGLQLWSPQGIGLWLLLVLATSQLALALVNWLVTLGVTPRALPRLDYSLGIAPQARTLVVVPTLIGRLADVDALADSLEVRFLANRDPHLQFALLTDLRDAQEERRPEDDELVDYAAARIEALNRRYERSEERRTAPFLLLHRPRRWNARDRVWMGHERKRGKLADLNALLRGRPGAAERFARLVGDTQSLQGVRYVITLDTDTQLPRDAAAEMISAMDHPLNRPRFGAGARANVVVEGYGILQPRVGVNLPSVRRSGYARIFGGEPGIDPYTRAVSDVYQDLFGEGSFIGKGIYDVDAFEHATSGSMPENRILSHDLIEGCYARSGLLSDVQLLEDTPSRYAADMARRHRWVRGDWQLIGWLRRRLHLLPGAPRNPLSALSRWKLFDNLRRSLVPIALVALAVLGWARLPEPFMWTLRIVVIVGIVPFAAHLMGLLRTPLDWIASTQSPARLMPMGRQLLQLVHSLACLPTEAVATLDAIARTLWRMVRGRRLLEWTASSDVPRGSEPGTPQALRDNIRALWAGPVVSAAIATLLADVRPWALPAAAPLLLLWMWSPAVVWWADRPLAEPRSELDAEQRRFLRRVARRTWGFFETYVGAADNHLPPDNVQLHPVARVAHRTSPTNVGFSLLANLTARDSGFATLDQALTRIAATVTTLERLERHRGHFYNWYDTQSLLPLAPRYISTVDSGNLVAQLMTLRMALLALPNETPFSSQWCHGLADVVGLVRETLPAGVQAAAVERLERQLGVVCAAPPQTAAALRPLLENYADGARQLLAAVEAGTPGLDAPSPPPADPHADDGEALRWARALVAQCDAGLEEFAALGGLALPLPEDATEAARAEARNAPLPTLAALAQAGVGTAAVYADRIAELARRVDALSDQEQLFLYDDRRHLMSIGYNVDERRLDASHYDLLASEARLGIFASIARGQLPQDSWFALGRTLTSVGGDPVLMSWSGSMFEYLMPPLIMPEFEHTLLAQTSRAAVRRQIEYGRERGVPWGISESGYNATDTALNYQYRAFGVPGLGLKRGLGDELVIAPYATAMATIVEPVAACANLQRLAALGAAGEYGFYEAVDYTPLRVPRGQTKSVVRSFMAHHQGMSLLAIEQALGGSRMQAHFAADPRVQATLMLLHERVPKDVVPVVAEPTMEPAAPRTVSTATQTPLRVFTDPQTPTPEVQLLSNGSYHVMVTQAGGGYSRYKDMAVTRWREDTTRDDWGSFCYLRDLDTGEFWSTAYQPTVRKPEDYQAIFTEGRAEFRRRDEGLDTHLEIAVSPEDAIELRRVRVKNNTRRRRRIELTSYCEVVLQTPASDVQHPAFGKLFVQTEIVDGVPALLANRRPRAQKDASPWMFHLMAVHGPRGEDNVAEVTHETDRARFIGRGGTLRAPAAMRGEEALSNSQGSVLDPVAASRCVIVLEPDQTAVVDLVIGVADTRADCLGLIEKYRDRRLAERVFELAWTHSQVLLRQLNASEGEAQMFARLAGAVLFSQGALRADPAVIRQNRRGQSGLWGYAISGDLPIVLVQISDSANLELVRQLVVAHAWWRLKGLAVDLVIWNEERDVYRQRLNEQVMGLIAAGVEAHVVDRPGGIFVRQADQIPQEDRVLLLSVARAVLNDRQGSLSEQLIRRLRMERRASARPSLRPGAAPEKRLAPFVPTRPLRPEPASAPPLATGDLALFNGYGGYAKDGQEYVVAPPAGVRTPAPWANVIANPDFGTVISESGAAYTWAENAHEWRLTPWHNDPVSDPSGETFYVRDEETGAAWMPCGTVVGANGAPGRSAIARHGFGYSTFEQSAHGIHTELRVFCAIDAPVKFSVLTLRNDSGRPRKVSATGYVEWVLGALRPATAPHIVTDHVADGPATARNPYSGDHADYTGFFDVDAEHQQAGSMTCDRIEFIGRNGSLLEPVALRRETLSGRSGAAIDPCAAFQVPLELAEGESRTVVFRLGMGRSAGEADRTALRFRGEAVARDEFERVAAHWRKTLGAVQVRSPDAALNALANGWLVYQTIACRLWARSGYYQSGGAFGFRDQLQDAMALVHARPELLRAQMLLAASRQFEEGDVQHWWHPPQGRGVRTHISDDYLWLPMALCRYVQATGDLGVLHESVPFIEGRPLKPEDESYFDLPAVSHRAGTLYEHAALAVKRGLRTGAHGLPLMGGGDWNDGMNLVGEHGQGESVWMGFFVCEVLREFAVLARTHHDESFAQTCAEARERMARALEENAWDGAWYRRAYFDDGTPLGTADGVECQIDSIAQSWAVLSGVAPRERARQALDSLAQRLVSPQQRIVRLLDPPFNGAGPNPGYISGYVPGVRENGGQYTHGAIWAAMAFASAGDARRAWDVVDMINPVNHARTPAEVAVYKVEPYVMTADVYSVAPHTGRGGWSWYTGSAGWMYRLIVEAVLGLRREQADGGPVLVLDPRVPPHWSAFEVDYVHGETFYRLQFSRGGEAGALRVTLDGRALESNRVPLEDDARQHSVQVALPATAPAAAATPSELLL